MQHFCFTIWQHLSQLLVILFRIRTLILFETQRVIWYKKKLKFRLIGYIWSFYNYSIASIIVWVTINKRVNLFIFFSRFFIYFSFRYIYIYCQIALRSGWVGLGWDRLGFVEPGRFIVLGDSASPKMIMKIYFIFSRFFKGFRAVWMSSRRPIYDW